MAQEQYSRELLAKRVNDNKMALFKDVVVLNNGMRLRKRQKTEV